MVGVEKGVQVIIDNSKNRRPVILLVKAVYAHILWTPCAVNLMVKKSSIEIRVAERNIH